MCVAGLHVCSHASHRWYELIRPCNPATNLQNCPEKLRLQGWEQRVQDCPYCNGDDDHHHSSRRLFGSTSSASSAASSPTISPVGLHRTSRRGSLATCNPSPFPNPVCRETSHTGVGLERATRARDMNDRIHIYLSSEPHDVLPSARKYYPTYSTAIARAEEASRVSGDVADSRQQRLNRRSSFSRGWQRVSKRWSVSSDMFKSA